MPFPGAGYGCDPVSPGQQRWGHSRCWHTRVWPGALAGACLPFTREGGRAELTVRLPHPHTARPAQSPSTWPRGAQGAAAAPAGHGRKGDAERAERQGGLEGPVGVFQVGTHTSLQWGPRLSSAIVCGWGAHSPGPTRHRVQPAGSAGLGGKQGGAPGRAAVTDPQQTERCCVWPGTHSDRRPGWARATPARPAHCWPGAGARPRYKGPCNGGGINNVSTTHRRSSQK